MNRQILLEEFHGPTLDARLKWHCPPSQWSSGNARLVIAPDGETDFWQKTHYGFSADNGHFLYLPIEGDFVFSTRVRFFPANQYDQAGLMLRFSPSFWLKTSVEYEPDQANRLGVVVTNHGYSDWSTQDYAAESNELALRIRREGNAFTVECAETGGASENWSQLRMAYLRDPDITTLQCGVYACSPKGPGFKAEFDYLRVDGKD